jgi:hypothetical protein
MRIIEEVVVRTKPTRCHRCKLEFLCLTSLMAIALSGGPALARQKYEKPPREILDVLNAPLPPTPFLSPARDMLALAQPVTYPAISDLAEPLLRLAGVRINPRTNPEAAIDKAVELGVTDQERVGVGGHSHGALRTANLLVYSDLSGPGLQGAALSITQCSPSDSRMKGAHIGRRVTPM